MKAGLRDPSLEALQNGLSAQTRPKRDRQRGRLAVTTSQCVSHLTQLVQPTSTHDQQWLTFSQRKVGGHVEQTVELKCIMVESSSGSVFLVKIQCN